MASDNGKSVVIVAIPAEDDPVWKYSSEKVPHMTMLFLGEISDGATLEQIAQHVEHIANTSMRPFWMDVDYRGELGPDNADVLFFEKNWDKMVTRARDYMLADTNIKMAFNSADQYPEWTPHLTMGYPETPAKPDNREYPGFHGVRFDRIALWTSDSDGPTFRLKHDESVGLEMPHSDTDGESLIHAEETVQDVIDSMTPEQQDLMDLIVGAAVDDQILPSELIHQYDGLSSKQKSVIDFVVGGVLSDAHTIQHSDARLDNFLAHHGVKGMKWGVRKQQDGTKAIFLGEHKLTTKATVNQHINSGTGTLGDAHLAALKTKGQRVRNAFLGDKTFWKRTAVIAGVTAAGVAASLLIPGALPVGVLGAIGSHIGVASTSTITSVATVGGHSTTTVLATHAVQAAGAAGAKAFLTSLGLGVTGIGSKAASTANTVSNVLRATRGNARINASMEKLGNELAKNQFEGSKKVQKILNRNGSVAMKNLKHSDSDDLDNFLAHHGIRGMKWGVHRKSDNHVGPSDRELKKKAKLDAKVEKLNKKLGTKLPTPADTKGGSADGDSSTPGHMSVDAERFLRTRQKDSYEMSDAELKAALNRAKNINDYNKLFNPEANTELKAKVEALQLQKTYSQLTAELNPSATTKVAGLISSTANGYLKYKQLDKASDGALSATLTDLLGSKKIGKHRL